MQRIAALYLLIASLVSMTQLAAPAVASDGVIEINQAAANAGGITPGDAPGLPVTISQTGSYRLTGNLLTGSRGTPLIEITAGRVHLDLGGFTVGQCIDGTICGIGSAHAIQATGAGQTTVTNGTVGGSGGECVRLLGGPAIATDLRLTGCETGLRVAAYARVRGVTVTNCGETGMALGLGSIVRDSIVEGCDFTGIQMSNNVLIIDSMIRDNENAITSSGGSIFESGGYRGCVISRNGGLQEVQPIGGPVRNLGGNICGTDSICP